MTRNSNLRQDAWIATRTAINALAALEDEEYPKPDDQNRVHVPAEFYHTPSIDRAASELELLYAQDGARIPDPIDAATDRHWLNEVAQELDWIRRHPPVWNPPPRCMRCGAQDDGRTGDPRNDGRPRQSTIVPVFRPGVGMTTMHADTAECR